MSPDGPGAFLRLKRVLSMTGMGRSWLYDAMARPVDPFPRPYRISERAVAWSEQEVRAWMAARPRADGSEAA